MIFYGLCTLGEGAEKVGPEQARGVAASSGEGAGGSSLATTQEVPTSKAAPVERPKGRPRSSNSAKAAPPGEYVHFPAAGVKIRRPEGFEKADSFDGFGQPETKSSVMAFNFPGPVAELSKGFTADALKARGWKLLSKQDVKIEGQTGVLIHFEQTFGGLVFLKWSLAFGDDRKTAMITATFPSTRKRELSERLKSVVLSTRPVAGPAPEACTDLPFTLAASRKLKLTTGISRTVAYTKDGVTPTKSPKDPIFIAAASFSQVDVKNKKEYSERRLLGTARTKGLTVKSTDAITIDNLEGYESLAEAEHVGSGTPLSIYQVILFDEGSYILVTGQVGSELRDMYLPEFKAMARSLQRKQP